MDLHHSLALAIKHVRKAKNLTQEDFALVSSRTYLSSLERGLKSPTLDKLDEIASVMGINPATLVLIAQVMASELSPSAVIEQTAREVLELLRGKDHK